MDKVKEQARLRQRKFYEKNKSSILQKRKDKRIVKKEVVIEEVIKRQTIDLNTVVSRIENLLQNGNEISMKTHIQRMKIIQKLTDFNDLEQDLLELLRHSGIFKDGSLFIFEEANTASKKDKDYEFLKVLFRKAYGDTLVSMYEFWAKN